MTAPLTTVVIRPVDKQRRTYEVHAAHGHLTDVLEPLFAAGVVGHGGLDMHLLRCGCSWTSPVKGEPLSACADCFASGWQLHVNDPVVRAAAVPAVAQLLRDAGIDVEVVNDLYRCSTGVPDGSDGSLGVDAVLLIFSGRAELTFVTTRVAADVRDHLLEVGLPTVREGATLHMTAAQAEHVVAVLMYGGSRVTYAYDRSVTRDMPSVEQHTNSGSQPVAGIFRAYHPSTGQLGEGLSVVATQDRDRWDALRTLDQAGLLVDGTVDVDWVPCGCFCTTLDVSRPDPACQRCDGLGSEVRVSECLVPSSDVATARRELRHAGFKVVRPGPGSHVEPSLSESWRSGLRGVSLAVRVHPKQGVATVQCEARDRAAYVLVSALLGDVGIAYRQGEFGLTTAAVDAPYVCGALLRVGCDVALVDPSSPSPVSWFVPHHNDDP